MRFLGALFSFLVCFPLLAQRVPVYTVDLTLDDVRANHPSTIELHPVSSVDRPIKISFRPGNEPTVIEAVVLEEGCDPASTESNGCDRMSFDPFFGRVEMRSFARQKGVSLVLDGTPTLFQTVPLRIVTRPAATGSPADVRITSPAAPKTPERIMYAVNVGARRHALAVDFRAMRGPATLLPLAALLSEVISREAAMADRVPRTTGGSVDTGEKPPTTGSNDNRSCFICDLCSNVPGGQTLGGCLGTPSLGGGGGGTATPTACTISTETALEVFQETVFIDTIGSSLCENTLASTIGTHVARFNKEATRFQAKVDTPGLDAKSKSCAACFRDMAKLFVGSGAGIVEIKGILSGNCIKDYATLKTHAAQYATMKGRAQKFIDDQALCKKACDTGTIVSPPATHRAYCDCLSLYLSWAPGPYPLTTGCPP
jgi:hypothetical protein